MSIHSETKEFITQLHDRFEPFLDEKQSRIFAGIIADLYGHGGIAFAASTCNKARNTVVAGIKDSHEPQPEESSITQSGSKRVRRAGGGRPAAQDKNPELDEAIEKIVGASTYGDPERVLVWTTLSLRKISDLLEQYGIQTNRNVVAKRLKALGYSKQQNQKNAQVGKSHPDRNAQFEFINKTTTEFLEAGDPVISVDTKKKENVGNFKNAGAEYRKSNDPRQTLDHDFPLPELGKVVPYGVYVQNSNTGYINLGTDHDTSDFAAESICRWWFAFGKPTFPNAKRIYITADGGGSNRARGKLWKYALQQVADITGLEIHMSHFPPGTSKWNKIEHRLFCFISKNWQGKPLIDIETIINLIGSTKTKKGLTVHCDFDSAKYPVQIKLTDEQIETINMSEYDKLGQWNYVIYPNK